MRTSHQLLPFWVLPLWHCTPPLRPKGQLRGRLSMKSLKLKNFLILCTENCLVLILDLRLSETLWRWDADPPCLRPIPRVSYTFWTSPEWWKDYWQKINTNKKAQTNDSGWDKKEGHAMSLDVPTQMIGDHLFHTTCVACSSSPLSNRSLLLGHWHWTMMKGLKRLHGQGFDAWNVNCWVFSGCVR